MPVWSAAGGGDVEGDDPRDSVAVGVGGAEAGAGGLPLTEGVIDGDAPGDSVAVGVGGAEAGGLPKGVPVPLPFPMGV